MKRATILGLAITLAGCTSGGTDGEGGAGGSTSASTGAKSTSASSTQTTGATMSAQQPFTAGSRLKVRTLTSDDGAKQQVGFYDSDLKIACAFALASDNEQRCLPVDDAHDAPDADTYFKDSECTVPIVVRPCISIPDYARLSLGGCPAKTEIRSVTGSHLGAVYGRSLGTCGQVMLGGMSAFDLGPAVPASTWARAVESVE